jgi:hypothetical protein
LLARLAALLLAALALLLAPAPAGAQSTSVGLLAGATQISQQSIPVRFAGQLTVTFHGDAASGCALRGLCGYSGTVSWRPPPVGTLEISTFRVHGRRQYLVGLVAGNPSDFFGPVSGVTSAHVELSSTPLGSPPTVAASCLDAVSTGEPFVLAVQHGRVSFALTSPTPSLLSTHCAGPLTSDLAPELPAPTVALSAVLGGRTSVDLTAARVFASHGFAGTVESSLTVALGRPGRAMRTQSSEPSGQTSTRELQVLYRATLSGSVVERVTGDADLADCTELGSCGVAGTVTVTPHALATKTSLLTVAPKRTSYRDQLAAVGLRHGGHTKNIVAFGTVGWRTGVVQADLGPASAICRDSAPLGLGAIVLSVAGGRLAAAYLGLTEPPRTRCPGPATDEAASIAAGVVPVSELAHRTITVTLTKGGSYADYGYDVRTVPDLKLTLTRVGVRAVSSTQSGAFSGSVVGR